MNEVSLTRFKRCTKCKCWKSATPQFFPKESKARDGISTICKVCKAIGTRSYRAANPELIARQQKENYERNREAILARCRAYNKENQEARREYAKRYREENLEALREQERLYYWRHREAKLEWCKEYYEKNRDAILARCRAYVQENPDRRREITRRYREENIEAVRELNREWCKANRDKVRENQRRRRARIRNVERVPYSEADLNQLWHDQEGCCYYCGVPVFADYHIEHMVPLSRGGSDKLENICLSCPACNWSKGTKTVEEFFERFHLDPQLLGGRE